YYVEKVTQHNWHVDKDGYPRTNIRLSDGRWTTLRLHNLISPPPLGQVNDHWNGVKLDCRKENLRLCTQPENRRSNRKQKNNTTGYRGVRWAGREARWVAMIGFESQEICLGYYRDKEEAAYAYDQAALQLFGEYARPNLLC